MITPTVYVYGVYELEDGSVKVFKVPLPIPVPDDKSVLCVFGHRIKRVIGHTIEESCANSMAERYKKANAKGMYWKPERIKRFCCKAEYEKYKHKINKTRKLK